MENQFYYDQKQKIHFIIFINKFPMNNSLLKSFHSQYSYPNNVKINYSTNHSIYSNPPDSNPKEFNTDVRIKVNTETGKVVLTIPQKQQSESRVIFNMSQNPDIKYVPQSNFNQPFQASNKYISYPNKKYSDNKQPSIASQLSQSSRQPSLIQNNIIYSNSPVNIPIQSKSLSHYQTEIYCPICQKNFRQSEFNLHLNIHRSKPYQQKVAEQNVYIVQEPPISQIDKNTFKKFKSKPQLIDNIVQSKSKEQIDQSPKFNNQIKQYNFDRVSVSQRNKLDKQKIQIQTLLKQSKDNPYYNLTNKNTLRSQQIQNQSIRSNDSFFHNTSFNSEPRFYETTTYHNNNSFSNTQQQYDYKPSSEKSAVLQYQEQQNPHKQSKRFNPITNNNQYNSYKFIPKYCEQVKPNDSFRFNQIQSPQIYYKNQQYSNQNYQKNIQDPFRFNQKQIDRQKYNQQISQQLQYQSPEDSFRFIEKSSQQYYPQNYQESFRISEKQFRQQYLQSQPQDSFRLNQKQKSLQYQNLNHNQSFGFTEKQYPQYYQNPNDSLKKNVQYDQKGSFQIEQLQDKFSDIESKKSYKTTSFKNQDTELLDDPMFKSNKKELEYNYDRLRRRCQIIPQKSELVSQASSQGKKKIPKNLLAVEMAISQRKQKQMQEIQVNKKEKQIYYK